MIFVNRVAFASPLVLAASLFAASVCAQTVDRPAGLVPEKPGVAQQAIIKFSEAGSLGMQSVRGARVAIFNGEPMAALKLMEAAKKHFEDADKNSPTLDTTTTIIVGGIAIGTGSHKGDVKSVPVDGQVILADDFVPTPEKQVHIDKANGFIRLGDNGSAINELLLGEIDVVLQQSWIPIAPTLKHLNQAIKLAGEDKYYQSNLSLKSIDDSIALSSVNLHDVLQSGNK